MARKSKSDGPRDTKSWGGPAKGPGNGNPRAAPLVGNASRIGGNAFKYLQKKERVEKLREMLFEIAETAEGEMTRVSAISKLWDREEGTPAPNSDAPDANVIRVIGGLPESE